MKVIWRIALPRHFLHRTYLLCLLCLTSLFSLAADPFASPSPSGNAGFLPVERAYLLSVSAPEDSNNTVALDWAIAPGYYLYNERMVLKATDATGATLAFTTAHEPGQQKYDDYFERDTEVFHDHAALRLQFDPAPTGTVTLAVEYQGCADAGLCYPPRQQTFRLDVAQHTVTEVQPPATTTASPTVADTIPAPPDTAMPPKAQHAMGWALFMALLGGLTLNLMPCVFPVLSLKIFAMTGHGDHSRAVRLESWVYVAGVVLSFVTVASVMLALRAGGESIGWGFQLQEPLFIGLLVYLFFILALSFSGVVHIGGSLMGIGQKLVAGTGYRSAFFTGILAVIVASPCSVPFMGVAVGYAITRSEAEALLIFATLGLGMALPFLLLAYWPQMMRQLPAPGPWMERLKQFLAFPLYATCLWLLYVLGEQGGHMAIVWVLAGLILLAMAGWLWRDADAHPSEKLLAILILISALVLPHWLVVRTCDLTANAARPTADETTGIEPYSAARLVELRAQRKPVFINLTAAWCITCLVNERVALSHERVKTHMKEKGITYLKGDWTNRNPEITSLLQQFDRSGVPLYLYFPPGNTREIVVLPQVLTEQGVIDALQ